MPLPPPPPPPQPSPESAKPAPATAPPALPAQPADCVSGRCLPTPKAGAHQHAWPRPLPAPLLTPSCLPPPYGRSTGGLAGDPHFTGFDGTKWDFQGVGNFTLLNETNGYVITATFVAQPNNPSVTWCSQGRITAPNGERAPGGRGGGGGAG